MGRPPPGTLPDWLSVRASKQGLAAAVHCFAVATAPTIRPPSEALFLGFLLVAVWASLRWGDLLWIAPDCLHLQLTRLAILGTALRTKTIVRSMPCEFLITGISGTPSANWGVRFHNLLRQALSDTHSQQPGRVIDFLPACLGGSHPRPFILEPCPRRLAVPRLLSLIHQHWRLRTEAPPRRNSVCTVHTAVLAWSRQMSLDRTLRRVQGHHPVCTPLNFMDVTTSVRCSICRPRSLIIFVRASVRCSLLPGARLSPFRTSRCKFRLLLWACALMNHWSLRLPFLSLRPRLLWHRCPSQATTLLWKVHPRPLWRRRAPRWRWPAALRRGRRLL